MQLGVSVVYGGSERRSVMIFFGAAGDFISFRITRRVDARLPSRLQTNSEQARRLIVFRCKVTAR